jgi:hypothetical protein
MEQIAIALFGVTAIFMSQSPSAEIRRYACVFGIIGQPFWFYSAYQAQQWGIFALCFLYSWAWGKGFVTHWLRRAA